ncbi:hypothetical protein Hamer_G011148, partial [Homarus americanus]
CRMGIFLSCCGGGGSGDSSNYNNIHEPPEPADPVRSLERQIRSKAEAIKGWCEGPRGSKVQQKRKEELELRQEAEGKPDGGLRVCSEILASELDSRILIVCTSSEDLPGMSDHFIGNLSYTKTPFIIMNFTGHL